MRSFWKWLVICLILTGCSAMPFPLEGEAEVDPSRSSLPLDYLWSRELSEDIFAAQMTSHNIALVTSRYTLYVIDIEHDKLLWESKIGEHRRGMYLGIGEHVVVPQEQSSVLVSRNLYTGEVEWTLETDKLSSAQAGKPKVVGMAVEAETLYLALSLTRGTAIAAVDLTSGLVHWSRNVSITPPTFVYAYDDIVVVNTSVEISWYTQETGEEIAKQEIHLNPATTPILMGHAAIINGSSLRKIDLVTLQELWKVEFSCRIRATPVLRDTYVYAYSACDEYAAIDLESGEVLWSGEADENIAHLNTTNRYAYLLYTNGTLESFDRMTGRATGSLPVRLYSPLSFVLDYLIANDSYLLVNYDGKKVHAFVEP